MFTAAELIQAYSKDPLHRYQMESPTIQGHQVNSVCWDSIDVFLRIEEDSLSEWSREGETAIQTTAAASMLSEVIQWEKVETILQRDYEFMKEIWLDVSPRRRRSIISALLATKNALHEFKKDGIVETYDDLL